MLLSTPEEFRSKDTRKNLIKLRSLGDVDSSPLVAVSSRLDDRRHRSYTGVFTGSIDIVRRSGAVHATIAEVPDDV